MTRKVRGRRDPHSATEPNDPANKEMKRFVIWTGLLGLCGCAWVHQTATLSLQPQVAPSHIGAGSMVAVRVIDKRPSKIIGYRGLDSKNAEITTDQDVAALFRQAVIAGLGQKGFDAQPYDGQRDSVLTVEIREIAYTTDMEMWKGIVQTKAVLHALALRRSAAFSEAYTSQTKETAIEAPRASTNERIINTAISEVVQRLVEDERLLQFLTQ